MLNGIGVTAPMNPTTCAGNTYRQPSIDPLVKLFMAWIRRTGVLLKPAGSRNDRCADAESCELVWLLWGLLLYSICLIMKLTSASKKPAFGYFRLR